MTAKAFNTRPFRTAHGKEPRGFGTWAFILVADHKDWDGDSTDTRIAWRNAMTYSDAKKSLPAGSWMVLS